MDESKTCVNGYCTDLSDEALRALIKEKRIVWYLQNYLD